MPPKMARRKNSANQVGSAAPRLFLFFFAALASRFWRSARSFFCCLRHSSSVLPWELLGVESGITTLGRVNFAAGAGAGTTGLEAGGGGGGGGGGSGFGTGVTGVGVGTAGLGGVEGLDGAGTENDGIFIPPSFGAGGATNFGVSLGMVGTVGFGDVYAALGGGAAGVASTDDAPLSAFSRSERSISFLRSFSIFLRSYGDKSAPFTSSAKATDTSNPDCKEIKQASAHPSALLFFGPGVKTGSPSLPLLPLFAACADKRDLSRVATPPPRRFRRLSSETVPAEDTMCPLPIIVCNILSNVARMSQTRPL